jgi:hypothetical protein
LAVLYAAIALDLGRAGLDLSERAATVRGICRRTIPRDEVCAVEYFRSFGNTRARLVLTGGRSVKLRLPMCGWRRSGLVPFARDFGLIQQWVSRSSNV